MERTWPAPTLSVRQLFCYPNQIDLLVLWPRPSSANKSHWTRVRYLSAPVNAPSLPLLTRVEMCVSVSVWPALTHRSPNSWLTSTCRQLWKDPFLQWDQRLILIGHNEFLRFLASSIHCSKMNKRLSGGLIIKLKPPLIWAELMAKIGLAATGAELSICPCISADKTNSLTFIILGE